MTSFFPFKNGPNSVPKPVLMVGGSLWLHWSRRHNSIWFIGNDHHKDSDFCSWHDTPIYEVNISQKRLSCTVVENPQKSLIKAKFWSHSFVIPILLSIIARKLKKNVRWDFFRFSNTVILVRKKIRKPRRAGKADEFIMCHQQRIWNWWCRVSL